MYGIDSRDISYYLGNVLVLLSNLSIVNLSMCSVFSALFAVGAKGFAKLRRLFGTRKTFSDFNIALTFGSAGVADVLQDVSACLTASAGTASQKRVQR